MTRASSLLFVALLGLSSTAFASDPYPTFIQTKYDLAMKPPTDCALCHTNGVGGTTPWFMGAALKQRGATGLSNTTLLGMKLDQLESEMVDTDGDGVIDVQELKDGTDPNKANVAPGDGGTGGGAGGGEGGGGGSDGPPAIKFGCGASAMPMVLVAGALGLLFRRRRR